MKNEAQALMTELLPVESPRRNVMRQRRPRPCGRARAAWWFEQMRRVVDEGRDFPVTGVR